MKTKGIVNLGLIVGVFVVLGVLATVVKAVRNRAVIDDRVDGFVSESVSVSKKHGIFVREYRAIPDQLRLGDHVVRIKAAWLEKWAAVDYAWVWFLKPKPTGAYRVIIDADCDGGSPGRLIFWHDGSPSGFTNVGSISWETVKSAVDSAQIDVRWHDVNEQLRIQLVPKE